MTNGTNVAQLRKIAGATPSVVYDVRQSAVDGKFRTWIKLDWLRLGLVSQAEIDAVNGAVFINPTQETCVLVTDKRPSKNDVLTALGLPTETPKPKKAAGKKAA